MTDYERSPARLEKNRRRSSRKHDARKRTINVSRWVADERPHILALARDFNVEEDVGPPPRTRGECESVRRPCPFVSCKWHMAIDAGERPGRVTINFPDVEPTAIPATCALDIADEGGSTLERVAEVMNMTRERVRQIEEQALAKVRRYLPMLT